jgi:hypothetical protein
MWVPGNSAPKPMLLLGRQFGVSRAVRPDIIKRHKDRVGP